MNMRTHDKYSKLPIPLKAALWFTVCQFLQKGVSIITTPIFTRLLSTEEYGVTSTYLSWENIILVIINLSLAKSINNLCVRYNNKDEILSSLLGLSVILYLPWCFVLLLFSDFLVTVIGLEIGLIISLFIGAFFQSIYTCWLTRMEFEYKYKSVVIVTLLYSMISSFGGIIAVMFISRTAAAKIYVQMATVSIIGLILVIVSLLKNKSFYNISIWKYSLSFCIPLLPHYFSEIVLSCSDRIMIKAMCGSSDVAIYSIAYSVGSIIYVIICSINSAFIPYQYKKIKAEEYDILAKTTNIVISAVAVILLGIMLFAREIVLIFGGNKYEDSIKLIIPICLGLYFNYVFQLFARVQEYYEQKHTIVIASVTCAGLNIGLNYFFIKIFGYKAAAYTTFLCYCLFCILHYFFYKKACKKHLNRGIYDIRSLLTISCLLLLLSILVSFINDIIFIKYLLLICGCVCIVIFKKRIIDFVKLMRR